MTSLLYDGPSLPYACQGEGAIPVLLLHGFGESGTIWTETAKGLSDICRVIVPDLPGCGKAAGLNQVDSLEEMADAIAELLDSIGLSACHIVGHSMGGYIALAFAERHPEKLLSLVMYHSTALPDSDEKKRTRMRSIEFFESHGVEPFLREAIPNLYAPGFCTSFPERVESHIQETRSWAVPETLARQYRAMMARPDRQEMLKDPRWPKLFIAGALDKAIPLQESLSQSALLPEDSSVVWDDVAHMGMRECPDRSLRCLREFLIRTQTS